MNYTTQYFPDPGIAYDIVKMCFVKLNPQNVWQESLTSINPQDNYIHYIQERADHLPDPKPEIQLFVYIPSNKTTTFLSMIVSNLISKNFCTFSISDLIQYLRDYTQVKRDLYNYYLGDQNYSDIDLDHLIRHNKNIQDKIKIMLLGFSLYPNKYISYLSKIIITYYNTIKTNWMTSADISMSLTPFIEMIIKESSLRGEVANALINESTISYSLCYTTPEFLYYNLTTDSPFFITTPDTITYLLHNNPSPSISELLQAIHAIGDKNRIKIINLLNSTPKLSIQEISDLLNLSLTAVKYHISLLKETNLISTTKNNNRKVFYSFNPSGFRNIIKSLEKIEKGEEF